MKLLRITHYAFLAVILLFMFACEQDLLNVDATPTIEKAPAAYIIDINDIGAGMKNTGNAALPPQQHVMSRERNNPFTVSALDAAEITARGSLGGGGHTVTDRYLKFTPQDHDDLYELEEADFFLTDYPWTREMITEGDFYQSTGSPNDFPELYTTVGVNTTLPDVPYVILALLDLSETDPVIIKQSFENTDNGQAYTEEFERNGAPSAHDFSNTQRNPILSEECADPNGCGGGTTPPLVNECGCVISRNPRRPGGTIKVEDTQYQSFVPVRRVRVVGKNNWFTWHRADTDDNGCWRIHHSYQGRAWFWVKFKDEVSDRGRFRFAGVNAEDPWKKAFTGKIFLGRMSGNSVNNILVRFNERGQALNGGQVHKAWAGATANNALHEYHDYAVQEGFLSPPKLNMMVMLGRSDGFAPMTRQMGVGNMAEAAADGAAIALTSEPINGVEGDPNNIQEIFQTVVGVFVTTSPLDRALLRTFFGDVNVGGDFEDSDAMKRLVYHELGHASHFQGSSVNYWKDVIRATVGANGHGDPQSAFAGHLQIAESWAEHIALTMVKQEYDLSLVNDNNGNTSYFSSWKERHERTRNESQDHIPIGLYNDLMDDINLNESVRDRFDSSLTPLSDAVNQAFTNSFFSSQLNSTVTSPSILEQRCIDNTPVGVSASDIVSLFQQY